MRHHPFFLTGVLFFLAVSLYLYCLFGGADFGAGILELFLGKHQREEKRSLIIKAMGPVWEANHIWLILAVVILFSAFPGVFYQISIFLHLPLLGLLFGIILRGCAFTFRSYDAVKDRSQSYYTFLFILSSLLTPLTLGILVGSVLLGRFPSQQNLLQPYAGVSPSYMHMYVWPWLNWFSLSVGIFCCGLFTLTSSVYLFSETVKQPLGTYWARAARIAAMFSIGSGAFVFITAGLEKFLLITFFLQNKVPLFCMGAATLLLLVLEWSIRKARPWIARVTVSSQVGLILAGWFYLQWMRSQQESFPNLLAGSAPEATLRQLLYALLVGSFIIFPGLIYLFKVFKFQKVYKPN